MGTAIKAVDIETGENVTLNGTAGEICVRGPQVSSIFLMEMIPGRLRQQ